MYFLIECQCNVDGLTEEKCNKQTGNCVCKPAFSGEKCELCANGFYKQYGLCRECKCNMLGTNDETKTCDSDGFCDCKDGYNGEKCDKCAVGYYNANSRQPNEPVQCERKF